MKFLSILIVGTLFSSITGCSSDDQDRELTENQTQQHSQQNDQNTDQSASSRLQEDQPDSVRATASSSAVSAAGLIGTSVRIHNGNEEIGRLEDILLDSRGQPLAAIISVGEFLGIGEKTIALDWGLVTVVPKNGDDSTTNYTTDQTQHDMDNRQNRDETDGQFHEVDSFVLMVDITEQILNDAPEFEPTRD